MKIESIAFDWANVYSREDRYYVEHDGARYLLELTVTEAPYGPPRSRVLSEAFVPPSVVEALEQNPRVWEHVYGVDDR